MQEKLQRLVHGWGINDLPYVVAGLTNGKQWMDPCYEKWRHAVNRSHSEIEKRKHPTYEEVEVCVEWKFASTFKSWFDKQVYYKGLHLDKDILVFGNKVYGPDTCAFVPRRVNTCIITKVFPDAKYPTGVKFHEKMKKNQYQAVVCLWGKGRSAGYHSSPEEAHKAWQIAKAANIEDVVAWYANEPCFRTDVADALIARAWKLRLDSHNGERTLML
jgi:hypothetical protein